MSRPSRMQQVAEEAILDHFRNPEHQPFHSDDLWHVIPDEQRGVISLAVMALVNKKLIPGCGYRKSAIPSRKRSPSQEYRLTELGRDRILAGVGSKNREGSGPSHVTALDRPSDSSQCGEAPIGARPSLAADSGEDPVSPAALTGAAGEPRPTTEALLLFEEEQRALNPLADAEAA